MLFYSDTARNQPCPLSIWSEVQFCGEALCGEWSVQSRNVWSRVGLCPGNGHHRSSGVLPSVGPPPDARHSKIQGNSCLKSCHKIDCDDFVKTLNEDKQYLNYSEEFCSSSVWRGICRVSWGRGMHQAKKLGELGGAFAIYYSPHPTPLQTVNWTPLEIWAPLTTKWEQRVSFPPCSVFGIICLTTVDSGAQKNVIFSVILYLIGPI